MKIKKILILFISLVLLAACSNNSDYVQVPIETTDTETTIDESMNDDSQTTSSKVLVVYYSASGSTKRVAEEIADELNADMFEVEPVDIYTSEDLNYTNSDSRVSQEHDDETLRDIPLKNVNVENWDDYNTVIIGYPIWWSIAAWPIDNFVKENDFTNKTVIPFCTSASSEIGQSSEILEDYANGGNWLEGHRFSSNVSTDDIKTWLEGLEL